MLTARLDTIIRVFVVFGMLLAAVPPRPAIAEPATQTSSPAADFSGTPVSGIAPLEVTFSNDSSNATAYRWDFGDGITSTEAIPQRTVTPRVACTP